MSGIADNNLERIQKLMAQEQAVEDSLAAIARKDSLEQARLDSLANLENITAIANTPRQDLQSFLADTNRVSIEDTSEYSLTKGFSERARDKVLSAGEEVLLEEENIAGEEKEAIMSDIVNIQLANDAFEKEYSTFKKDRELVMNLKEELKQAIELRDVAYTRAYPEWYQASFLDVTKNSDKEEIRYNDLKEAVKLYENKITDYERKWFTPRGQLEVGKIPMGVQIEDISKYVPYVDEFYPAQSHPTTGVPEDVSGVDISRMDRFIMMREKVTDMAQDLQSRKEIYFQEYGLPVEDQLEDLDFPYEEYMAEEVFRRELSGLEKETITGTGAKVGGYK